MSQRVSLTSANRVAIGVLLAALVGCAQATPAPAGPGEPQKTVTMKFADPLPEQDTQVQAVVRWTKDVEERTKKTSVAVTFEYFFASQLYAANQVPRAIAEDAIETGIPRATAIGDQMTQSTQILQAPLLWDDEEHWRRALDGEVGQILMAELEKYNLKVIWFNQFTPFEWCGRERPILKPDDTKGMRLRSLGGIYDDFYQAFGGVSVNVPAGEQYSALQRGVVDGQLQDYGTIQSRKLYEVLKFCTKGAKLMIGGNPIPINLDIWKSLPKDTQDAIWAAGKDAAAREVSRVKQEYDEIARDLESKGLQLIQMTDADHKAWFAYRKDVEDAYIKRAGDLGRKVLDASAKYRK
ncbi:MAG: TRAP transporter substrate-binding protein DctP [Chloroflexi bacterium]|nr:TRAP transporter substrate-binding protein DctP [Chloroflexota bacterium]